jgi:predicted DNA binding CopG/RHH family protein
MKDKKLEIPDFENEDQEARWWAENPDLILAQFKSALSEKRLGRGTTARRGTTPTTTIRLDPTDILRAKSQAERRGLKYQTYLKMLIHQALRQEESEVGGEGEARRA